MSKCSHDCKEKQVFEKIVDSIDKVTERVRDLENNQVEYKTELKIYMRQINETISDMRAIVNNLTDKQVREAEVKEIVRNVIDNLKASGQLVGVESRGKLYLIIFELLKILTIMGGAIAGIKLLG